MTFFRRTLSSQFSSVNVKRRYKILLVCCLVLSAAALAHDAILKGLGSYLVKVDPPGPAEIVVVLDGDGTGHRILKAAELVRTGFAPKALVSGGAGNYGNYACDLAIPFAAHHGYPESYFIHLENTAKSTETEAQVALQWIRAKGYRRVLLVTSDYHTHRAGSIYKRQAPELTFITVAAPDDWFTANGWWHNREGRKTFLYEWMKTVANWF